MSSKQGSGFLFHLLLAFLGHRGMQARGCAADTAWEPRLGGRQNQTPASGHTGKTGQIPLKVKPCPGTAAVSAAAGLAAVTGWRGSRGGAGWGHCPRSGWGLGWAGLGCPLSNPRNTPTPPPHLDLGSRGLPPEAPRRPGLAAAAAPSALGSTRAGPGAAAEGEHRLGCGESAIRGAGHRSLFVLKWKVSLLSPWPLRFSLTTSFPLLPSLFNRSTLCVCVFLSVLCLSYFFFLGKHSSFFWLLFCCHIFQHVLFGSHNFPLISTSVKVLFVMGLRKAEASLLALDCEMFIILSTGLLFVRHFNYLESNLAP